MPVLTIIFIIDEYWVCTNLWVQATKTGQGFGDKFEFPVFLYNLAFYNQLSISINPAYRAFIPLVIIDLTL